MRILTLLTFCLAIAAPARASEPVFTVSTLSKARIEAGDDRLIVVYLHEQGNADCDFMASTSWTDPAVTDWVDSHAVAARVDAFSFHGASLRGKYQVKELPAILAFRGGELARRHQGALEPTELAAWLEVARIGDVATADAIAQDRYEPAPDPTADIDARLVAALSTPSPEAATDVLLTLWRDTRGSEVQAERRARVGAALRPHLIDEGAQRMTARERDAAWARHKRKKSLPDLLDWIALNSLLGDDDKTLDWVRGAMPDRRGLAWVRRVLDQPNDPLLPLLSARGHWPAIGDGVANPIEAIDRRRAWYAENRTSITGVQSEADQDELRRYQGAIVAGLLAARRDREAKTAAEHVAAVDREAGPAVVKVALEANQPRRWMRKLLNPHRPEQVQLALDLTQALQGM